MKKHILFALLFCLAFCTIAFAEPDFTVTPNPPKGINYSYKFNVVLFKAGESTAFMDKYAHELDVPVEQATDDVYVSLEDLRKIYAPDFTVTVDGNSAIINHVGLTTTLNANSADAVVDQHAYTFQNPPKVVDGTWMVPAQELMRVAFAKETSLVENEGGNYYAVAYGTDEIDKSIFGRNLGMFDDMLAGMKKVGFVYMTYTIEDDPDQKILPVRAYIPTTYDPEKPMRTILLLHGRSVNQNYFWADSRPSIVYFRRLETFAEEYGYIIITPTAYRVSGEYGDVINIPYMFHEERIEIDDAERELRVRSEKSALTALELISSLYNVDKEHLYLMGNSMAGKATLYLGNKYADMWDALVPCGMMPNMSLVDEETYANLVDMPLLFVEGTEDTYGFQRAMDNFAILASRLNNAQCYAAAGGQHDTGWCIALPKIFEFLNAQ